MKRHLKIKFNDEDEAKLSRVVNAYSNANTDAEVVRILVREKYFELEKQDSTIQERISMSLSRRVPTCKHYYKKHYAKGLCKECYDKKRVLEPTKCVKCLKTIQKYDGEFNTITRKYICYDCLTK